MSPVERGSALRCQPPPNAYAGGAMTLVALALIVVLAATVASFTAILRSQQRSAARREDLLVNQLMHLAGKAWTPPPAEAWTAPAAGEPLVRDWTPSPEQQPLYT